MSQIDLIERLKQKLNEIQPRHFQPMEWKTDTSHHSSADLAHVVGVLTLLYYITNDENIFQTLLNDHAVCDQLNHYFESFLNNIEDKLNPHQLQLSELPTCIQILQNNDSLMRHFPLAREILDEIQEQLRAQIEAKPHAESDRNLGSEWNAGSDELSDLLPLFSHQPSHQQPNSFLMQERDRALRQEQAAVHQATQMKEAGNLAEELAYLYQATDFLNLANRINQFLPGVSACSDYSEIIRFRAQKLALVRTNAASSTLRTLDSPVDKIVAEMQTTAPNFVSPSTYLAPSMLNHYMANRLIHLESEVESFNDDPRINLRSFRE